MSRESLSAATVLGVALKLHRILSDPDTPERIVSLPTTPLTYQADTLRFGGSRNALQENTLAEFSDVVNRVPTGSVWKPSAETHLWDVYGDVLSAEVAQDNLTAEQRQEYDTAERLLFGIDEQGRRQQPTDCLQSYTIAKQAWTDATVAYRNAESAAAASSDAAVRQQWLAVEEPQLRQARDVALAAWSLTGFKAAVETAYRTIIDLGARMPTAVWDRYRAVFDPQDPAGFNTAPNGLRFVPTFYTPAGVLDSPWPRVQLTRDEIATLELDAPPVISAALGRFMDDELDSVAFDYSVVSISRPWIDPVLPLLTSRAWRFPAGAIQLSDGGSPPLGRFPAFVDAVALIRNIETRLIRTERDTVSEGKTWLQGGEGFDFDKGLKIGGTPDAIFGALDANFEGGSIRWVPAPGGKVAYFIRPNPELVAGERIDLPFDAVDFSVLNELTYESDPQSGFVTMFQDDHHLPHSLGVLTTAGNVAKVEVIAFGDPVQIRWTTYAVADTEPIPAATAPDDIYIGALVCRRLPRTPDPDPALPW